LEGGFQGEKAVKKLVWAGTVSQWKKWHHTLCVVFSSVFGVFFLFPRTQQFVHRFFIDFSAFFHRFSLIFIVFSPYFHGGFHGCFHGGFQGCFHGVQNM